MYLIIIIIVASNSPLLLHVRQTRRLSGLRDKIDVRRCRSKIILESSSFNTIILLAAIAVEICASENHNLRFLLLTRVLQHDVLTYDIRDML